MMTNRNANSSVDMPNSDLPGFPASSGAIPLTDEELDWVAGGGGKTGASTNPVED
jgi:hypothetical protein